MTFSIRIIRFDSFNLTEISWPFIGAKSLWEFFPKNSAEKYSLTENVTLLLASFTKLNGRLYSQLSIDDISHEIMIEFYGLTWNQ